VAEYTWVKDVGDDEASAKHLTATPCIADEECITSVVLFTGYGRIYDARHVIGKISQDIRAGHCRSYRVLGCHGRA